MITIEYEFYDESCKYNFLLAFTEAIRMKAKIDSWEEAGIIKKFKLRIIGKKPKIWEDKQEVKDLLKEARFWVNQDKKYRILDEED